MLDLSPIVDAMQSLHGVDGVYTPKAGGEPVEVVAVAGRDSQDSTPNRVVRVGRRSQDWLISVASYAPEPQVGDQLRVTYHDRETVWELRSDGQSLPWEWSDRAKLLRRLHMVEILEELAE